MNNDLATIHADEKTALIRDPGALRIAGFDPGLAICGYGVVDLLTTRELSLIAAGVITTNKAMPIHQRLATIRQDVLVLLNKYRPDVLAIERLFFFRNASSMVPVCEARGVVLESVATIGIPVFEYTPMQVKLCLTGYGRADKAAVQLAVKRTFQQDSIIKPDDAADAAAIAICHARLNKAR